MWSQLPWIEIWAIQFSEGNSEYKSKKQEGWTLGNNSYNSENIMFQHYGQKMLDRSLKNGTNPQFIGNLIDPVYSYKDQAGTFFFTFRFNSKCHPGLQGKYGKDIQS